MIIIILIIVITILSTIQFIFLNIMSPTWNEVIGTFEEHLFQKGRSKNTIDRYSSAIKKFGAYYSEKKDTTNPFISRLKATDLKSFIEYLESIYQSESSINSTVSAFHIFAEFIIDVGWHKKNIATDLRTRYIPLNKKSEPLTPKEMKKLLAAPDKNSRIGLRDYTILQLAIQCCLQTEEIRNLSVGDFFLIEQERYVRIFNEKTKDYRNVSLNKPVQMALRRYLKSRGETTVSDPLFLSLQGKRISKKMLQYLIKNYLCIAGRPDLSATKLRRCSALALYEETEDFLALHRILGNQHFDTTARYLDIKDGRE